MSCIFCRKEIFSWQDQKIVVKKKKELIYHNNCFWRQRKVAHRNVTSMKRASRSGHFGG